MHSSRIRSFASVWPPKRGLAQIFVWILVQYYILITIILSLHKLLSPFWKPKTLFFFKKKSRIEALLAKTNLCCATMDLTPSSVTNKPSSLITEAMTLAKLKEALAEIEEVEDLVNAISGLCCSKTK